MKKVITLLLCLCMVLALFTACGSKEEAAKPDSGKSETKTEIPEVQIGGGASGGNEIIEADEYKELFRIGGQMEFPSLDFHESLNAYYVVTLTHDTLVTYTNGEFEPALATEWNKLDSLNWEFNGLLD